MAFAIGQPCWLDITVKDEDTQQRLERCLSSLLQFTWQRGEDATGNYDIASLDGRQVMAIGRHEYGGGFLAVYLHCDDVDARARAVTEAGGHVFMPPTDLHHFARLALAKDPTGAIIGMWQGRDIEGFQTQGTPGSPVWFDGASTNVNLARGFYTQAFDLEFEPVGSGGILKRGDTRFASLSPVPDHTPSFWNPVFMVEKLADAEQLACDVGFEVTLRHTAVPMGLISMVESKELGLTLTFFQREDEPAPTRP